VVEVHVVGHVDGSLGWVDGVSRAGSTGYYSCFLIKCQGQTAPPK
jgi:hypothetical protein